MSAQPASQSATKASALRRFGPLLRLCGTAIVLGVLFLFIPVGEVWANLSRIDPLVWVGVFIAHIAGHALAAAKWRSLVGPGLGYFPALRAHFAGLAANIALPGVAGGDLVRAGVLLNSSVRKSDLVLASLLDRVIDTATLLLISTTGVVMLGAQAGLHAGWIFAATAALVLLGGLALVFLGPIGRFVGRFGGYRGPRKLIAQLGDAIGRMAKRRLSILACILMSTLIQAGFALLNAALAVSVGGPASPAMWLFAWPLAKLIATLPISLGGIGVREASLTGLFAPFGFASAPVVAASLAWQSIVIGAGLLGGALQGIGGGKRKGAEHV